MEEEEKISMTFFKTPSRNKVTITEFMHSLSFHSFYSTICKIISEVGCYSASCSDEK